MTANTTPDAAAASARGRGARGAVLFGYGFRPFFLLAGIDAVVAIPIWLGLYLAGVGLPTGFAPIIWHSHEMLYGFAAAVLCGFMLTAVPNWTGAPALRGAPLAALAALWLAGRILFALSALVPVWLVAAVDLLFIPAFAAAIVPHLLAPAAKRQRPFVLVLAVLVGGNLLVHLNALGFAWADPLRGVRLAVDMFVLLITIMGGRIVPSFTASALRLRGIDGTPRTSPLVERLAIGLTALAVPVDLVAPDSIVFGAVALAAGAAQAVRLAGWRGGLTLRQPILWSLHLGYGWTPVGLLLEGMAVLSNAVPVSIGIHALTVGAIGTMTLAVMSRVALGHTGRALVATPTTVAAYVLITLAALVRVFGVALAPAAYPTVLILSGSAWSLGFALFVVTYGPILLRARADGRPG